MRSRCSFIASLPSLLSLFTRRPHRGRNLIRGQSPPWVAPPSTVESEKYGSQTVFGSHSHKTGTIEKRNGNNNQSGEVTKIAIRRRVGSSKRLPKESICPTQNSVKDSGKKVTKSERRKTDVKGTEIEANVTRVNDGCVNSGGSTHTMNCDFLNNSHGMAVFPPYPRMAIIPQFPRYPPYGGVPMYPPYPPYYTGTNTRISSGGVGNDNEVKKNR